MIIDGTRMFTCQHEYFAFPWGFACHKCDLRRPELPLPIRKTQQRLFFFPFIYRQRRKKTGQKAAVR